MEKTYSISEVADLIQVTSSTLRFYDKKGLLPFVVRNAAGQRRFNENDLNFIKVIDCLKKCGVKIDEIAHFIDLCMQGDATLPARYDYLNQEEQILNEKIEEIQAQLAFLQYKKWYFKTAIEAGTESIHYKPGTNFVVDDIHDQFEKALQANGLEHSINFS